MFLIAIAKKKKKKKRDLKINKNKRHYNSLKTRQNDTRYVSLSRLRKTSNQKRKFCEKGGGGSKRSMYEVCTKYAIQSHGCGTELQTSNQTHPHGKAGTLKCILPVGSGSAQRQGSLLSTTTTRSRVTTDGLSEHFVNELLGPDVVYVHFAKPERHVQLRGLLCVEAAFYAVIYESHEACGYHHTIIIQSVCGRWMGGMWVLGLW